MTRDEFIFKATEVLTNRLRLPLQEAIEKATAIVDCVIELHRDDFTTVMVDDLKICPKCQTSAWLLEYEDGDVVCLSCGSFFMAIDSDKEEERK
jgi:hypothetical protein